MASKAFLEKAYLAYFGRPVDPTGLTDFAASTEAQVADAFAASAESKALYGSTFNYAQINAIYLALFNREAEKAGLEYWYTKVVQEKVYTPAGAAIAILNGAQNADKTAIENKLAASAAFSAALDTAAEMIGYSGDAAAAAARSFLSSVTTTAATAAAVDAAVASTVAAKTAVAGQTFTLTTGTTETITTTGASSVVNGTQLTLNASDTIIGSANGTTKLSLVDTGTAAWSPTASISNVQTVALRNINATAPVAAVKNVTQTTFGTVVTSATAGTIITFANVATADVVITPAVSATHTGQTLAIAAAAAINAAAGSLYVATVVDNTLTLTAKTAGTVTAVTGVLTLSAASTGVISQVTTVAGAATVVSAGATDTIAAGIFGGATSFENDVSTSQVDITGLTAAQSVTIVGNGATTNGATNATWGATVTAPVLNLKGGTTGSGAVAVTANGATSLTINSTSASNTIGTLGVPASATALNINATSNLTTGAITAAAVTTITASGAATLVNLGTLPAAVTTINGSGLTAGGITTTLTSTVTAFTGGAGVDTVTTVATTTAASKIDGGAGAGDILNVNDTTSISTIALGARFTNFEILRNTAGGATANVSNVAGITAIQLGATGQGATGMTAAQALNVTNRADNATQTLALTSATGTADVLTVTLLNSTSAATSADLTGTTVDGFETMNVVSSSGGVGDINALGFASAANLKTLNLTGAMPISVTTTNITTTGGTAINASGVTYAGSSGTKAFTITGNLVKGSSVVGSNSLDTITVTAAAAGVATEFVTYDGGAGNDLFNATVAAINNNGGATASVKIEGGAGTDTLNFTENGLTLVDANFQYVTGIETITYAVANQAISITGGAWFNTNFGSNTTTTLTLGDATNAQINTVNLTGFTGNATVSLTATAAQTTAQSITTGSGNDAITALVAGITTGSLTVVAGAGNDTINVTSHASNVITGTISLNGGTGQDTFTITAGPTTTDQDKVTFVIAAGDSLLTGADVVTGFALADGTTKSYILDFAGTAVAQSAVANQSVTGYSAAELQYTIANGKMTFAGTSAAGLTAATKASIAQTYVLEANASVVFTQTNGDGTVDSYVFNNNTTADSLVQLVGVNAGGLGGGAMVTSTYITVA